jgi:hypothetical protein
MNQTFQQLVAVVTLAFFWSTSVAAQSKASILQTTGHVSLNGRAAPANGTTFAGDKIETAGGSTATVSSDGIAGTFGPNTIARVYDTHLEVICGSVDVMTFKGTGVTVDVTTVHPVTDTAKFTVSHSYGKMTVQVKEGEVNVLSGKGAALVKAGNSFSQATMHEGCPFPVAPYVITGGAAAVAGIGIACAVGVDWCRSNPTPSKP